MKKLKKILTSLLTAVMTVSLAMLTVSAEGEGAAQSSSSSYTITINNSTTGHTYEAYQVFKGDLIENDGDTLYNIVWGSDVQNVPLLQSLKTHDSFRNCDDARDVAMVLDNSGDNSAIAEKFAGIVNQNLTTPTATVSEPVNGKYQMTITQPGYYLIKDKNGSLNGSSSAYTRVILKLVNDVTIEPKSIIPEFKLKVYEEKANNVNHGFGNGIQDVADACIGQEVQFHVYSDVPDTTGYTAYNMKFNVDLGTFNYDSLQVSMGGEKLDASSYKVSIPGTTKGETREQLSVTLPVKAADKAKQIDITIYAHLTGNAVVGQAGNVVSANLEYSNNPNDTNSMGKGGEDKVVVFTYGIQVTKKDGDSKASLSGAGFNLYRMNGETKEYFNSYNGEWINTKPDWGLYWTSDNGVININGLDDGTYYLEEVKAPDGYIVSDKPIQFKISASTVHAEKWDSFDATRALTGINIVVDNNPTPGDVASGIVSLDVLNYKGSKLPGTGGSGTIWFTAIGGILIFAGVAYLLVSRRKNRRS